MRPDFLQDSEICLREAKSPIAARRFKELVNSNFFTGSPFYRVMPGFLVQFGLSGNVTLQREWDRKVLQEERAIEHKDWNMRGTIAFATSGAGGVLSAAALGAASAMRALC